METINSGIALIENKTSDDINLVRLQIKELGLSVILLGLAEHAAKRIEKMSAVISKLEDELFDPNKIDRLTDPEKIERYNLAMSAVNSSAAYIKSTTNNIDWNGLEIRLRQLTLSNEAPNEGSSPTSDTNLRAVADMLLAEIGRDNRKP